MVEIRLILPRASPFIENLIILEASKSIEEMLELIYLLNENTGSSAKDETKNCRDGTLNDGYTWVKTFYGYGVQFNGTTGYLNTGYTFTIEATEIWAFLLRVKASPGATGVLMGIGHVFPDTSWNRVQINFEDNKARVYVRDDALLTANFTGDTIIADNKEHLIMLVVNPNDDKVILYVDGRLDTEIDIVLGLFTFTCPLLYGALSIDGNIDNYSNYILDESIIMSRQLV